MAGTNIAIFYITNTNFVNFILLPIRNYVHTNELTFGLFEMVDRDILNLINSKNMNWCIRLYSTMYLRLHQYLDNFLWLVKIFNMFELLVFVVFWKFEKLMNVEKIFAPFFSLLLCYGTNNDKLMRQFQANSYQ